VDPQWPVPALAPPVDTPSTRAEGGDRVVHLPWLNELKPAHRLGLVFCLKKLEATTRISPSSRTTRLSRRSFLRSSRSAVVRPSNCLASTSACLTHGRSEFSDTPRPAPTPGKLLPLLSSSRTASARNSDVCGGHR